MGAPPGSRGITGTGLRAAGAALWLLAIALGCVIGRASTYPFVAWDDGDNVYENPDLNPPTAESLLKYWQGPQLGLYVPVVFSAWSGLAMIARLPAANAQGVTLDPAVFHLANLLGHLLASFIVWLIFTRLLRESRHRYFAAFAGAMLFALHPLQVEPVAWITGFKDVLGGTLALAALLMYIVAVQVHESGRSSNWLYFTLATLIFGLAILAKPAAVCIPMMALVIDRLLLGRSWKAILPLVVLWTAFSIVPIALTSSAQLPQMPFRASLILRPYVALDAIGFYADKLLLPIGLGIDHGRSPMLLVLNGTLRWSWIPGLLLCLGVWCGRRRFPILIVPAILFVAGLAPVLGLLPFVFQNISTVADRYAYIAMLGPALLLARVFDRFQHLAMWLTVGAVIAVFAGISFVQTGYWSDTLHLMTHAIELNPQSKSALIAMGNAMHKDGRLYRASRYLEKALAIDPCDPDAQFDYGNVLFDQQRPDRAVWHYEIARALNRRPRNVRPLLNLGAALALTGNWGRSEVIYGEAVKMEPKSAEAHSGLGRVLEQRGDFGPALVEYRSAIALNPRLSQPQNGVARIMQRSPH